MQRSDPESGADTSSSPSITASLAQLALQRRIVLTAAKVALVVGAILNLINNGGRVLEGLPINGWQFALNFVVPYCVSSYSAAKTEAHARHTSARRGG